MTRINEAFMAEALELAEKGRGFVSPNPVVGALLVKNGKIAGRGYHAAYGGKHAEIPAIEQAGDSAKGADLYVTLEPCNHVGKTEKCTEKIIKSGIKRVIIALKDPNPNVEGGGIGYLKENGIQVIEGVLKKKALFQNRFYLKSITTGMPYVILKWAMSLDGVSATKAGDSRWISCEGSRHIVHELRHELDAVLIGANTVLTDNPLLTCRGIENGKNPVRIIIDPMLRTPREAVIVKTVNEARLLFVISEDVTQGKRDYFEKIGAEFIVAQENSGQLVLSKTLEELYRMNVTSILVEGGGITSWAFIDEKIADEVVVFCAPCLIGGGDSKRPLSGKGIYSLEDRINIVNMKAEKCGDDILIRGLVEYKG